MLCLLTDGSAADGVPRLAQTRSLPGVVPGPLFGVASDRAVYAALLQGDIAFFTKLALRLAAVLRDERIETVVADAAEGYNPSHDIARMLADAASRIAAPEGAIGSYAFPLVGDPGAPPPCCRVGPAPVRLDGEMLATKIAAARAYASESGGILANEVDEAIARYGIDAFREERVFVPGDAASLEMHFDAERPFYEVHGERQVAAGIYAFVVRWAEHVRPVARALRALAAAA